MPNLHSHMNNNHIRKGALFGLVLLVVFSGLAVCTASAAVTYGSEASNPTGNPIGGGAGYTDMIKKTDPRVKFVVSTKDQFLNALKNVRAGDIVYIEGTATIDLTGIYSGVTIPAGVTIASNRGENGSPGGRIVQNAYNDPTTLSGQCALKAAGEGVRLTGLRLEGPHKTTVEEKALKRGFVSSYKNTEVDNCEIWGWSYAGVNVGSGTTYAAHIHHNYIHHCQRGGYGYGILNGGVTLVEANLFDHCRHAVADSGSTSHFYEARYNTFNPGYTSRILDMHGEGTTYCGSIYAHHNTFVETSLAAARIRAVPQKTAYFEYNWYLKTNAPAIEQKNGNGNIKNVNNIVGSAKTLCSVCPIKLVEYNGVIEEPTTIAATPKPAMLPPLRQYSTSEPTTVITPAVTPTPEVTVTPTPSGTAVWIEAESMALTNPMVQASDAAAAGGAYIWVPQGNGDQMDSSGTQGTATYTVDVPASGVYTLWARVSSPTAGDDSFWILMDASSPRHWDFASNANWHWEMGSSYTLSAGTHTIVLKWREDGTKLDKLLLTTDTALTPSGTGGTASPTPAPEPTPTQGGETTWIEAESMVLTSPMVKDSDATASAGAYAWVPQGNGDQMDSSGTQGTATYTLNVPESKSYTLWARVSSPTAGDDSLWASMDGSTPRLWDFASNANWHWEKKAIYTLSAGEHTITLKWREDGTKLDKLLLTTDATLIPS
jgi:hypothetical protein